MDNSARTAMPMKWHKFLIYFGLWLSAAISVIYSYWLLTGSVHGYDEVNLHLLYTIYEGLKGVDIVFGVLMLADAAYLIYTRFQLAGFKAGAPNKLTIAYAVDLAITLGYSFAVAATVKRSIFDTLIIQILNIAPAITAIFVNRVYYNKRAHLFGDTAAAASAAATDYTSSAAPSGGFCPNCGARVDADDMFCVNCGAKLK